MFAVFGRRGHINLAINKVTLSKHVTWSLKEKNRDRYNVITTSSDYTVKLQLNCCQIEDGQLRDRTQNLAANKYKHISARTIYMEWDKKTIYVNKYKQNKKEQHFNY
ncbi:hypothetical protein ACJX0J_029509 [Zea mays]